MQGVEVKKTKGIRVPYAKSGREPLRHCEAQLSPDQAQTLRDVFDGLNGSAARMRSGRFVQTTADTVRWILEEIGAVIDGKKKDGGEKADTKEAEKPNNGDSQS